MAHNTRGYVHRVDIRAELDDVWQALIDPAILARWHVPNARVDARERGHYWTRIDANLVREAHIDIYQPPRRLRLIYLPLPSLPDDNAVLVDDFLIDLDDAASREAGSSVTIMRLMGSGIPDGREWDSMYMRLRSGWERALLRLKVAFERDEGTGMRSRRPAPKAPTADEKLLEWPDAGAAHSSGPNPLTTPPVSEPTGWKSTGADDFLAWPEPTPTKKR
jgi:uncharacterized protein YndB with AHSA1/START domain